MFILFKARLYRIQCSMNFKSTLELYTPFTLMFVHPCMLVCVHTHAKYVSTCMDWRWCFDVKD